MRLAAQAEATGNPVAFDSSGLIDYVSRNEPVASLLDPLLDSSPTPVVVSTVVVTELIVRPVRDGNTVRIDDILRRLRSIPHFSIVDFDQRHGIETATVRAQTGLKFPDAAIIATARLADASAILGNDRRWRTTPLGVPYHHIDDILAIP